MRESGKKVFKLLAFVVKSDIMEMQENRDRAEGAPNTPYSYAGDMTSHTADFLHPSHYTYFLFVFQG